MKIKINKHDYSPDEQTISEQMHHIKNAFFGMQCSLNNARKHASGQTYKSSLDSLQDALGMLMDITSEITDMARPPNPSWTNVNDLLSLILGNYVSEGYSVNTNFFASDKIYADSTKIRRALENLVKNAIEAMPGGGILDISTSNLTGISELFHGRDGIRICISDNGKGIGEPDIKRIFERYYTKKEGGTGLGLMITLGLITNHGGSIVVDSEENKGTCFEVYLPKSKGWFGEYTRQHRRLCPSDFKQNPSLLVDGKNIDILDLSEGGVKVANDNFILNYCQNISGGIILADNDSLNINGKVLRANIHNAAIRFDKALPQDIFANYLK